MGSPGSIRLKRQATIPWSVRWALKRISITGRMALAVTVLETVRDQLDLRSPGLDGVLDRFWRFVDGSAELSDWDDETRAAIGEITDVLFGHRSELPAGSAFRGLPRFVMEMIYHTAEIGGANMYGGTGSYSPATYAHIMAVLEAALSHGFAIPPLKRFRASRFSEEDGWGAPRPREFFIPGTEDN